MKNLYTTTIIAERIEQRPERLIKARLCNDSLRINGDGNNISNKKLLTHFLKSRSLTDVRYTSPDTSELGAEA